MNTNIDLFPILELRLTHMKAILFILLYISTFSLYAQREGFAYNEIPESLNAEATLVFVTYTESDAKRKGWFWNNVKEYNDYVTKQANKIYTGKKVFLTDSELKTNSEGYNFFFQPVVMKTDGFRKWPAGFGIVELSSGSTYMKNKMYVNNPSAECKGEIKHIAELVSKK